LKTSQAVALPKPSKIAAMIGEIDAAAERELLAIIAEERKNIKAGRPSKENVRITTHPVGQTEDASYLLRRLARDYEASAATSVIAGFIAADPFRQGRFRR
jgi:hypothetical protein